MDADVRGHAAALADVALPRRIIPMTARCDIGQIKVIDLVFRPFGYAFLERDDGRMQPQLQYRIYAMAAILLFGFQRLYIPRVQYNRLLANDIRPLTQTETDMCVVQIVGCADTHEIQTYTLPFEFGQMPVKEFHLCKEGTLRKVAVHDAHAVEFIVGREQGVARILNGFQVARRDIAAHAYQGEIFHLCKNSTFCVVLQRCLTQV